MSAYSWIFILFWPSLIVWSWRRSGEPHVSLLWALYCTAMTVAFAVAGQTFWSVFNGGLVAYYLWDWWRRRKRRKLADLVLGVVRDLGHRLTVVNVPAGDGAR